MVCAAHITTRRPRSASRKHRLPRGVGAEHLADFGRRLLMQKGLAINPAAQERPNRVKKERGPTR